MEWSKKKYNEYYTSCTFSVLQLIDPLLTPSADMPWIEDKVLGWWGENKTSYVAKDKMKTRVVGDENVNKVQDGVADGVGGQFGKGGLLNPVGEGLSQEGMNRAERGDTGPVDKSQAEGVTGQMSKGASAVGGGLQSGVSSLTGGGGKEEKK